MIEIRHYIDSSGRNVFMEWRDKVNDIKAKIAIDRRIMRLELGNYGDSKPLREGVWELRIDVGPGYRVYYSKVDLTIILLLFGGTKRNQNEDIARASSYLSNWKLNNRSEKNL